MKNYRTLLCTACGCGVLLCLAVLAPRSSSAYPPTVGILSPARNCVACHLNNGPWKNQAGLIIDIVDKSNGKSLRQTDGTFLISAKRGELKTVMTIIGWRAQKDTPAPYRNAWLYVDPRRITDASSLNKFAPGWAVNLPMSCRVVGDPADAYPGAHTTVLPMTVRAALEQLAPTARRTSSYPRSGLPAPSRPRHRPS